MRGLLCIFLDSSICCIMTIQHGGKDYLDVPLRGRAVVNRTRQEAVSALWASLCRGADYADEQRSGPRWLLAQIDIRSA